jgi:hypothetical protein
MRGVMFGIALCAPLCAQVIVPPPPGGLPSGTGLRCIISPIRPVVNFGLRLQAGYAIRVPLAQYRGSGHNWRVLLRIVPDNPAGPPVYLGSRFELPAVPKTKTDAQIGGAFLLGEGRYDAALALEDDLGRVCTGEWQIEASFERQVQGFANSVAPGTVVEFSAPPADSHQDPVLERLTVLLHAAPTASRAAQLQATDVAASLGQLSALLQHRPARSVRLVVFNLAQQKQLLSRDDFRLADLEIVRQVIYNLQLARVDYRVLQNRDGAAEMLAGIVEREIGASQAPDAVVFLGPRQHSTVRLARHALTVPRRIPRFFYLAYQHAPRPLARGTPSDMAGPAMFGAAIDPLPARVRSDTDLISEMVSRLKGKTIPVTSPADFAHAIGQISR